MRKIVNPTEGVRLNAIVEKDGIGFIPRKVAGPAAVEFNGRFATVEEGSGEIKYKDIEPNHEYGNRAHTKSKMHEKIRKSGFRVLLFSAITILATLLIMFMTVTLPYGEIWVNVLASILYLMTFVLLMPQAFTILLGRIFGKKDIINFSKYLGAKNAVENAYYDLGRAPSMEEIKKYSLYASEDKYTQNSCIIAVWLIINFVKFLDGWAYWIVTICAILMLCWLEWRNKLAFVQAMVVSNPDEIHYKVAIAAMEEAADLLDHVEIHFHTIEFAPDPENFNEERCSESGCPAYDFCKEESQKMTKNKGEDDSAK